MKEGVQPQAACCHVLMPARRISGGAEQHQAQVLCTVAGAQGEGQVLQQVGIEGRPACGKRGISVWGPLPASCRRGRCRGGRRRRAAPGSPPPTTPAGLTLHCCRWGSCFGSDAAQALRAQCRPRRTPSPTGPGR
jgi:hypothetical protein